jgi:hypothetical protein
MKIEIELDDRDAKFLSKWASVSRTLNAAKSIVDKVAENTPDGVELDKVEVCYEELISLEPVLNRLHQTVRSKIWEQQK